MSPELTRSFERSWPPLAHRLQGFLISKGIPACKRDDIIQEAGLRLFSMWDRVDASRPVWGLVVTIALNLLRDEARKRPQREVLGAVPDVPTDYDIEQAGLARIELDRVKNALEEMSSDHRRVILLELGDSDEPIDRGPNATKMLRMRARRELAALLQRANGLWPLAGFRLRAPLDLAARATQAVTSRLSANQGALPAAGWLAALAAMAVVPSGLLVGPGGGLPGLTDRDVQIQRVVAAVSTADDSVEDPGSMKSALWQARGPGAGDASSTHRDGRRTRAYRVPVGNGYVSGEAAVSALGQWVGFGESDDPLPVTPPNSQESQGCSDACGVSASAEVCVEDVVVSACAGFQVEARR